MTAHTIGIIGGSGLYAIDGLTSVETVSLTTPFGSPSDEYLIGHWGDQRLIFLPRHGRHHSFLPSDINFRANIYGFKQLGAEWLISVSAVGSMKETIHPGEVVIVDQFFDHTKRRASTFFGEGVVGHVPFADPVCADLSGFLFQAARDLGIPAHQGGTYLCIEGPQFSTRAESRIYRSWGVDVIGMTNMPEAKLAREAGIGYATIALVTDYDCWHEEEADVSVATVLDVLHRNVENARRIILKAVTLIPKELRCRYAAIAKQSLLSQHHDHNREAFQRLALFLGDGERA